jgi:hypothetical protein
MKPMRLGMECASFLGPIGSQLASAPLASSALLRAIPPGADPPPYTVGESIAADSARQWASLLLNDDFAPSADVNFVAISKENGWVDVVRARYEVDGYWIDIAQTLAVASVVISQIDASPASPCDRAMTIANTILTMAAPARFLQAGLDGDVGYGEPEGPRESALPHWEHDLRWWCAGECVGFVVLKATGHATRTCLSFEDDGLGRWFNALEPRGTNGLS